MSSRIRRHTIIAGKPHDGIVEACLEKDWYSYGWVSGWPIRHVITRPQGEFHVVSMHTGFSRAQASFLVDAAITGKTRMIDLREILSHTSAA